MTYRAITGKIKARSSLHIGSREYSELSDALVRRNAAGDILIPGMAIAGVLRTLVTRLAPRIVPNTHVCKALHKPITDEVNDNTPCQCAVCLLFGDIIQSDDEEYMTSASRVRVYDAYPSKQLLCGYIRDGVGIDRQTGAAARASLSKFDLETVSVSSDIFFDLRLELTADVTDMGEQLLAAALSEWQAERCWIGGRVARGMGACKLEDVQMVTWKLDTSNNVFAFLQSDTPWVDDNGDANTEWVADCLEKVTIQSPRVDNEAIARTWAQFECIVQAQGPLVCNDTLSASTSGFDHAPLLLTRDNWLHPVLPGSSIRGVLRSHAERIARTLTTHKAWTQFQSEPERERYFKQHCPACYPMARRSNRDAPDTSVVLESCDSLLRYTNETYDGNAFIENDQLCLACRLFGSTRRGSRLIVEDALWADTEPPRYKMLDFLAIDRFTGGGVDRMKFDALVLWKPSFRVRFFLDNPQPWELGWLTLVLRDMRDGMLAMGYGASKGFGRVTIADGWSLTLGLLDPDSDFPLSNDTDTEQKAKAAVIANSQRSHSVYTLVAYSVEQQKDWLTIAEGWVAAFNAQVHSNHCRDTQRPIGHDSYFGRGTMHELYPVYGAEEHQ